MKETVIDYDKENDVCYINFHKPPLIADDSDVRESFIFRAKRGEPIGITIIDFSECKIIIERLYKILFDAGVEQR